jgi:hypothetical protein
MRARALALPLVVLAACTSTERAVHVDRASAFYTPAGDAAGQLLIDGEVVATCASRWSLPEIVCDVDALLIVRTSSVFELVVDGVGRARRELAPVSLPEGRHLVLLDAGGGVHAAVVSIEIRVEPVLPMPTAVVLYVLAGIGLAFALWAVLRARFLTVDDARFRRSVSIVTATIAMIIAWLAMIPFADHARQWDPTLLAFPAGLGGYALAAVGIDGFASRRAGGRRILIALVAIAAIACLPVAMAITLVSPKYFVVGAVIAVLLLLV